MKEHPTDPSNPEPPTTPGSPTMPDLDVDSDQFEAETPEDHSTEGADEPPD